MRMMDLSVWLAGSGCWSEAMSASNQDKEAEKGDACFQENLYVRTLRDGVHDQNNKRQYQQTNGSPFEQGAHIFGIVAKESQPFPI